MRINDIIRLAYKNVMSSRIKGILSVISVCIGIASVALVSGIGWGVSKQIDDELSRINTGATVLQTANDTFGDNEINEIKNTSGIKGAGPLIFEFGKLYAKTQSMDTLVVGIDKDFSEIFDIKTLHGFELGKEEKAFENYQVIVDNELAEKLYYRTNIIGKKIQLGYGQGVREYEVVGVIQSPKAGIETLIGQKFPAMVYIPYQTVNDTYGENKVSIVALTCENEDEYDEITSTLVRKLNYNSDGGKYQLENISSYAEMVSEITDIVAIMISCVAGISVIVGGIGMMSSMISNIESRKTEIGIYMALGINRRDILKIYICESVMISAAGGLLGIMISIAAVYFVERMGIVNVNLDATALAVSYIIAVLWGIMFGYIPAKKAASLRPMDAIRWE